MGLEGKLRAVNCGREPTRCMLRLLASWFLLLDDVSCYTVRLVDVNS